jgi:hypothetical protein
MVALTADHLPEDTEKRKKKKAALIFFLKYWKRLKSETERVAEELGVEASESGSSSSSSSGSSVKNIITGARGPVGLVTAVAVGVVAITSVLKSSAVEVTITNRGCQPITPQLVRQIDLPGLKLPSQTIADGQSATAVVPPLRLTVTSSQTNLRLSGFKLSFNFNIPETVDLLWNGQSLRDRQTSLNLGSQQHHQLVVDCKTG